MRDTVIALSYIEYFIPFGQSHLARHSWSFRFTSFVFLFVSFIFSYNIGKKTEKPAMNINELPPFCKCTLHTVQMSGFHSLLDQHLLFVLCIFVLLFRRCSLFIVVFVVIFSANSFFVTVVVQLKRAGVYVVCNTVGYFASHKRQHISKLTERKLYESNKGQKYRSKNAFAQSHGHRHTFTFLNGI